MLSIYFNPQQFVPVPIPRLALLLSHSSLLPIPPPPSYSLSSPLPSSPLTGVLRPYPPPPGPADLNLREGRRRDQSVGLQAFRGAAHRRLPAGCVDGDSHAIAVLSHRCTARLRRMWCWPPPPTPPPPIHPRHIPDPSFVVCFSCAVRVCVCTCAFSYFCVCVCSISRLFLNTSAFLSVSVFSPSLCSVSYALLSSYIQSSPFPPFPPDLPLLFYRLFIHELYICLYNSFPHISLALFYSAYL